MNILIIEDEPRSANRLARMISAIKPCACIFDSLPGVERAVDWFENNPLPDIVFLDIELQDGTAFDLLERIDISTSIIFCTAFSHYAVKAFQANSIDYILKPVTTETLAIALAKYDQLNKMQVPPEAWRYLRGTRGEPTYRWRFLVKGHSKFEVVPTDDVIAIGAWLKASQIFTICGRRLPLDETLKVTGESLNPSEFFQISRETIVRLSAIAQIERIGGVHLVRLRDSDRSFKLSRARVRSLCDIIE